MRIPLPQDFGAFFVGLPIAVADAINNENPEAIKAWLGHIVTIGNPVGAPVLVKSIYEYGTGRNLLFDRPIVPGNLQKDQPGSQFNRDTGLIARKLGEAFPETLSPIKLEYLAQSVAGSVGLNTIRGPELMAELMGLKKGVRQPDDSDAWFYGRLFRKGGKYTSNAVSIIEFFDDYERLDRRMISQDKALEEGQKPLNPLTRKEERYYYELADTREGMVAIMEIARNANRKSQRESGYRAAAKEAQKALNQKPDDPLLPW
jgi:hypothetical protein